MSNQPETFWAYLAAFIDGEGSITMCQNGPRLIITNTHLETLTWIKESIGTSAGSLSTLKGGYGNTKPCYNLSFGSNSIRFVLPRIIPYLRIKRRRAEILLDYLDTVVPRGGSTPPPEYHTSFKTLRAEVKQRMLEA